MSSDDNPPRRRQRTARTNRELRRWAMSQLLTNVGCEITENPMLLCELADVVVAFVETGEKPAGPVPARNRMH